MGRVHRSPASLAWSQSHASGTDSDSAPYPRKPFQSWYILNHDESTAAIPFSESLLHTQAEMENRFFSLDQLEDVVNEACSVIPAEDCVITLKLPDQSFPALIFIMHNIITSHVHIEFDPVNFCRQIQRIWGKWWHLNTNKKTNYGNRSNYRRSFLFFAPVDKVHTFSSFQKKTLDRAGAAGDVGQRHLPKEAWLKKINSVTT